ncbi:hypothetical protein E2C01_008154 [Portunus trituberculatus]|uniref:Uncharacterized protein n=1 Tax=Portunus trituberculatus TaxID=210409 RepID=A0A5B7D221_PORTR|nr:hypothetical protein [Portunus trituberculatus]
MSLEEIRLKLGERMVENIIQNTLHTMPSDTGNKNEEDSVHPRRDVIRPFRHTNELRGSTEMLGVSPIPNWSTSFQVVFDDSDCSNDNSPPADLPTTAPL